MKKLIKLLFTQYLVAFGPRFAISDTDAGAFIIQFKDAVKELAGGPSRSYLKEMAGFESCSGASALIGGSYQANLEAGARTALASLTNRYTYDQVTTPTATQLSDALLTRNDSVVFQRTQVLPEVIDVGRWFEQTVKEFLCMSDPQSREMRNLMQGLWTKEDLQVITALFAATQTRVATDAATATTTSSVSMPVSQILPDTSLDTLDHKIFSAIKKRFMKQYVAGQTIYAGFGPDAWEALVNNSGDKLMNQDYVDSANYFMGGDLPKCYGVVPVVHPLFENSTILGDLLGEGETGLIGAWTEDGITVGEFMPMDTMVEINSATHKGQSVVLIKEACNVCRNDDLLVVQGAVKA